MWISQYFVLFIIYGCIGWVYETIYCTIKSAKWDNRGFLLGPICPIYGVGGVAITVITDMVSGGKMQYDYTWVEVFLVSFFGSILLEYFSSWVLEKLFHAYWWDYSNQPLNIKGRVCFFCSLGFGFAGLLVVYVIAPGVRNVTKYISPVGYEILALIFMGLISIDITLTVSALTHFENGVALLSQNINSHMEQFVETIVEKTKPTVDIAAFRSSMKDISADKKQSVFVNASDEREYFSQENLEQFFRSMGRLSKASLRRVKGFRRHGKMDNSYLEEALSQLKQRISKNRE